MDIGHIPTSELSDRVCNRCKRKVNGRFWYNDGKWYAEWRCICTEEHPVIERRELTTA